MTKNIINFPNCKKTSEITLRPVLSRLSGYALFEHNRSQQIAELVKNIKGAGGYIYAPNGERITIDSGSMLGLGYSSSWVALAPHRNGSPDFIKTSGQQVSFVVTAYYPLLSCVVYFNYSKKNDMYFCQSFVYQNGETVPTCNFSVWLESIQDGMALMGDVTDKGLERITAELKKKHNMGLIDFEKTKYIHSRILTKYKNQTDLYRKTS